MMARAIGVGGSRPLRFVNFPRGEGGKKITVNKEGLRSSFCFLFPSLFLFLQILLNVVVVVDVAPDLLPKCSAAASWWIAPGITRCARALGTLRKLEKCSIFFLYPKFLIFFPPLMYEKKNTPTKATKNKCLRNWIFFSSLLSSCLLLFLFHIRNK